MKKIALLLILLLLVATCGCTPTTQSAEILATTRPVYDFTTALCQGTGLEVDLLITENVSCLHDYSLSTAQMIRLENAEVVVISGAGLEDFQADILQGADTIDASTAISLLECSDESHEGHDHEHDPHIWLSPIHAKQMVQNIYNGLIVRYPEQKEQFSANLDDLLAELDQLLTYGQTALQSLSCRELITFHDGFSYLAQAFDLTILAAVEEESGSEASASDLKELVDLVNSHHLPAIFNETSGSTSASGVISAETGVKVFTLDMCMGNGNYFDNMYKNIDTLKEALE